MNLDKQLLCRIFGTYIGCEISIPSLSEATDDWEGYRLYSVDTDGDTQIIHSEFGISTMPAADVKLILTPLPDMTDDDMVEIAKIANVDYKIRKDVFGCDYSNYVTIGRHICHVINNDLQGDFNELQLYPRIITEIIDALRKLKYDIGFESVSSLIESEYAVSSTEKPIDNK